MVCCTTGRPDGVTAHGKLRPVAMPIADDLYAAGETRGTFTNQSAAIVTWLGRELDGMDGFLASLVLLPLFQAAAPHPRLPRADGLSSLDGIKRGEMLGFLLVVCPSFPF